MILYHIIYKAQRSNREKPPLRPALSLASKQCLQFILYPSSILREHKQICINLLLSHLKIFFFKFACTRSYLRHASALLPRAGSSQRHIGSSSLACLGSSVVTTGPPGKSLSHFKSYLHLFF